MQPLKPPSVCDYDYEALLDLEEGRKVLHKYTPFTNNFYIH